MLFRDLGIPWHQGRKGSPLPHLRSSQVQCVNALGQMASDPTRIERAFSAALGDLGSVRDFGEIDPSEKGRLPHLRVHRRNDYLGRRTWGEAHARLPVHQRRRGLRVPHDGWQEGSRPCRVEVHRNLSVRCLRPGEELTERTRRYGSAIAAADGPSTRTGSTSVRRSTGPSTNWSVSSCRARPGTGSGRFGRGRTGRPRALAAERGVPTLLHRPRLRDRGDTVDDVWRTLLRRPEGFVKLDPVVFLDPAITSEEYVARYGGVFMGPDLPGLRHVCGVAKGRRLIMRWECDYCESECLERHPSPSSSGVARSAGSR